MREVNQSKLLSDASDLQKRLGRAQEVLRGMETEHSVALTRLSKLRVERTAAQSKFDVIDRECVKVAAQVDKLADAIRGLGDMLTQFAGFGTKKAVSVATPVAPKKLSKPMVRIPIADAGARRLAIIEACTTKPRTMPELRQAFPEIIANNLRPLISLMVKGGQLKMTGTVGTYVYTRGPRATEPVVAAKSGVKSAAPKPAAAPKRSVGRPPGDSLRDTLLKMVLAGPPRTSADFYVVFPKANPHTIQSALSHLAEHKKIGRMKIGDARHFTYCAPGTKPSPKPVPADTAAQPAVHAARGAHMERVLVECKTPMQFADLALKLPDINRHVLHQTVHALVYSKRLRSSGKRNEYIYETIAP